MSGGAGHDLEFSTSVDGSVQQNVPLPPQTNNVLSGMIDSAAASSPTSPSPSSSYTPGSSTLPSVLQFSKSSHPTACLFHILFKGMAFTLYIMGSKMMEDIMVTVLCILLLAADFWVVKNITGRLLVGLRWWSKYLGTLFIYSYCLLELYTLTHIALLVQIKLILSRATPVGYLKVLNPMVLNQQAVMHLIQNSFGVCCI